MRDTRTLISQRYVDQPIENDFTPETVLIVES